MIRNLARTIFDRYRGESIVIITALITFVFLLNAIPLSTPNEGLYAEVAREMLERHDWVIPHINGVVYFEKPPLLYWLVALSFQLFGVTALAARLPSALAGCLTTWIIYGIGRRFYDPTVGAISSIILSTSLGFVVMARQVMFDALLTACITLALAAWWFALSTKDSRGRNTYMSLTYLALALAVLAKGFIGLLLPLLVICAYCLYTRDKQPLKLFWTFRGTVIFLLVAVPWHFLAVQRNSEFAWFYFVNEHLLRFLGKRQPADYHTDPIYTPFVAVIALSLPWSAFLPAALYRFKMERESGGIAPAETEPGHIKRDPVQALQVFLLCWVLMPLLFFTLSRTRIIYYQLPAIPPLALYIGSLWRRGDRKWSQSEMRRWLIMPLVLFCGLVGILWLYFLTAIVRGETTGHEVHLGRSVLALIASSWMFVGFAIALRASLREDGPSIFQFGAIAMTTLLCSVTALLSVHQWPATNSEEQLAMVVAQSHPTPGTIVALKGRLENHSSFLFYLPHDLRPIYVVDGRMGGDLEFGSHFPEVRSLFITKSKLYRLAKVHPVFYLTENEPEVEIPPQLHLLMRQNHVMLWGHPPSVVKSRADSVAR